MLHGLGIKEKLTASYSRKCVSATKKFREGQNPTGVANGGGEEGRPADGGSGRWSSSDR